MTQSQMQESILEFIEESKFEEAVHQLHAYKQEGYTDIFFYLSYSDVLMHFKDYQTIITLLIEAIDYGYTSPYIYERLGDAYFHLNQYQHALNNYLLCDINADIYFGHRILFMQGLCFENLSDYDSAVNCFEDILLDRPDDAEVLYEAGYCYKNLAQSKRSFEYFDKSAKNDYHFVYNICTQIVSDCSLDLYEHYLSFLPEQENQKRLASLSYFYETTADMMKAKEIVEHLDDSLLSIKYKLEFYQRCNMTTALHEYASYVLNDLTFTDSNWQEALDVLLICLRTIDIGFEQQLDVLQPYLSYILEDANYFLEVADYSVEVFNKELSSIFIENDLPEAYILPYQQRYMAFRVSYYITYEYYQEGLDYVLSLHPDVYKDYYRSLVIFYYYLQDYQSVISLKDKAMPNGIVAFMLFISYGMCKQELKAFDFLEEFTSYLETHDVDDSDIFLSIMSDLSQSDFKFK